MVVAIIGLLVYMLINTFTYKTQTPQTDIVEPIEVDRSVAKNLARAVQIQTISYENKNDFDSIPFVQFNRFLKNTYPLVDSVLDHKLINSFSHLYHWKGTHEENKPVLLMSHLDVVPVIDSNRKLWKHPPFGGEIDKDTLWGRGTIDDKLGVVCIMESIEYLLKQGFRPQRDIFLAFGHDEEIGGFNGAATIADYLKSEGIYLDFVLDEGGSITKQLIPGIKKDVALIGIAEKGFLSVKLSVELEGGHSSMPAKETAIDVLAGAIQRLKANPLPATISEPIERFMEVVGPQMEFRNKLAMANISLFKPLVIGAYTSTPSGNALMRTTTSPTIFNSGVKENIIPLSAEATVNFRIISGSSVQEVINHVEQVVNDDRISLSTGDFVVEPSKVSDVSSHSYQLIERTVLEIFPKGVVAPYLVVGATDSRHFRALTDHIYRFLPVSISPNNIKSFHGINERVPLEDVDNAFRFYVQLVKNMDQ